MSSAASGVVLGVALLVASGPVMAGDAVGELRDRGGRLLGTVLEADDRFLVARDCRGRLVGRYDRHTRQSRDARGILVGSGNWLARLIPECAN